MILISETRTNIRGGVTACRNVVVESPQNRTRAEQEKAAEPQATAPNPGVSAPITEAATKPFTGPKPDHRAEAAPHHPRRQHRANHMPTPYIASVAPTPVADNPR